MKRPYGSGRYWKRPTGGWCIEFHVRGQAVRESVAKLLDKPPRLVTEKDAARALAKRLAQVQTGTYLGADNERRPVSAVLDDYYRNLRLRRGDKAESDARLNAARLSDEILRTPATRLQTAAVEAWTEDALEEGEWEPATINNSVGALCAALRYAWKSGRLARVPYLTRLSVKNARQGFFERAEYLAVLAHQPAWIADMMRVSYFTGARRGELLGLTWETIDRAHQTITFLDTKNGDSRTIPIEGELVDVIERRWKARRVGDALTALVFHSGKGVSGATYFGEVWRKGCVATGYPDKLFHDLRRTFARNELAAGVPENVIMAKGGWKSRSVFLRYAIVNVDDMREATRRNLARLATL